jgi:hypothetical protein
LCVRESLFSDERAPRVEADCEGKSGAKLFALLASSRPWLEEDFDRVLPVFVVGGHDGVVAGIGQGMADHLLGACVVGVALLQCQLEPLRWVRDLLPALRVGGGVPFEVEAAAGAVKVEFPREVAVDRDAVILAAGGSDGSVSFWDPWAHTQLSPALQASWTGAITSVAYSSDGKLLAAASSDWTIRLWDSQTHAEIGPPFHDTGPVKSIVFTPDGTELVSAGLAGVRVWDITSRAPSQLLPTS